MKIKLTEVAKVIAGGGTGGGTTSLGVPQLVTVADPLIPVTPALNTQFIDVSADGRFLVFDAGDVVGSSPTGGRRRVFYTDMQTAQTHLVSRTTDPADVEDCDSTDATISSDGSTIAFVTCSSNLELSSGSVTPGIPTLVIMDRASGELEAVANNVSTGNTDQGISISGDGNRIAFVANTDLVAADTNGTSDAYVFERGVGLRLVSQSSVGVISNGESSMVNISDDGNHVIFRSAGTNLDPSVTLFQGSGAPQPYAHNLLTGETQKISAPLLTSFDAHTPSISADGQFVAFISSSNEFRSGFNFGDSDGVNKVYVRDLDTGQVELVSTNASREPANGTSDTAFISANGRFVIFSSEATNLVAGDSNGQPDVFIKDLQTEEVNLVSINESGQQMDQVTLSLATESLATMDAKQILFSSYVINPIYQDEVLGDVLIDVHDLFVRNRDSGTTTRVSLADDGSLSNGNSFGLSISRNGRYVLFISSSTNLLPEPHNPGNHIFMRDTLLGRTTLVSEKNGGGYPWGGAESGSMSGDASVIAFASGAGDIVADDTNGYKDIFIKRFGMTYRIMGLFGSEPNNDSSNPIVSSDGFKVLFRSLASNLVPNDINGSEDWFSYDVQSGVVSLASTDQLGYQLSGVDSSSKAAISADGHSIVYGHTSSNNGVRQLSWKSITGAYQPGDLANVIPVSETKIKADITQVPTKLRITNSGEYAFIQTNATNIVQGSNMNGSSDVFRFDLRKKYFQLLLHSFDSQATNNTNEIKGSVLGEVSPDGKTYQVSSNKVSPFDRSDNLNTVPSYVVTEGVSGARTFDVINVDQPSIRIDLNPQSMVMDTSLKSYFLAPNLIPGLTNDFGYLLYMKSPSGVSAIDLPAPESEAANGSSFGVNLSEDGNRLTFISNASNLQSLITHDSQVYLRDMDTDSMDLVSQSGGVPAYPGATGAKFSGSKYIVFESRSMNLVPEGSNGNLQIYLKNLETPSLSKVSLNSTGVQGNGLSYLPAVSPNGKFVVFSSYATNLVAGDTNSEVDVFLRNLETNTTSRLSVSSSGVEANGSSGGSDLSSDGRYVVFTSFASNLVPNDTNGYGDVFLRDTILNTTTIVSLDSSGNIANNVSVSQKISADGRYILFLSEASNLVAGDTNGAYDVFIHDRMSGETSRVSVGDEGQQGNHAAPQFADFSADGRYVVFVSSATNLISGSVLPPGQVYVRDRQTNTTFVVSKGIGNSYARGVHQATISDDGSAVAFVAEYMDVGKVIGVGPQIFWRKIR